MNRKEADEIIDLWSRHERVHAVRLLRTHSPMGLLQAKNYLEETNLQTRLYADFVQTTPDLLRKAHVELRRLLNYIEELEGRLALELEEMRVKSDATPSE